MENKKSNKQLVAGILFLIIGAILFAQNFIPIDISFTHYIFHWQSLLIFIGIFAIAGKPQRFTGYFLIFLGVIFWIPELFDVNVHLIIWPVMLIGVGTLVLLKGFFKHDPTHSSHFSARCTNKAYEVKISPREH